MNGSIEMADPTSRRTVGPAQGLAVLLVGIVAINLGRTAFVPAGAHFPLNASFSLYALGVAYLTGLSATELGLSRETVGSGVRLGGVVFAVISAVVVVGGVVGLIGDDRADVSTAEMVLRVLVVIPVGTVVMEELLFRSVLHGLLARLLSSRWTATLGSALFGLWHVFPASRGGSVSPDGSDIPLSLVVAATFLATSAAGWGFIWLRDRSGSVVAPMLAHLATNSVTYLVAWLAGGTS